MSASISIPSIDLSNAVTVDPNVLLEQTNAGFARTFRVIVERIKRVRRQATVRVAVSHGKDSTLLLNAALQAHIELTEEGELDPQAPFICTNIDTRVDDIYVRGQIIREVKELKRYCAANGVNLRYLTATPPARYSWAVMYASGAKLPSFVKSSADCSIILKIDPAKRLERELFAETGDNLITLLGSRSDESARRSASIKKHSTSVDEIEINGGEDGTPRTCAPMADLTDGDVFGILRRMGETPIIKTSHFIPSYAPHHKLIIKLYGDAQETCPVTSFADAAVPKTGSCGASRFGCTLCLKVTKDKSATARSASAQYAAAANVLAIRDYLAHHAEDMSLREPLAKSVCPVTNTLVIQENTFNAQTLERMIYWLAQATRDDRLRAERFKALVAAGRVDEDPGYQEIMRDPELSQDDKAYFGEFYIETHQRHMLQLIDLEQIMLICAIHARDGVKLPPFHALWIFNEVEQGRYIPFPKVEGEMKSDPVPEPRFAQCYLPKTVKLHLGDVLLDTEFGCGESASYGETHAVEVGTLLARQPLKRPLRHSFTKRKVVSKRRAKGQITSITRGRMGVQFTPISERPALAGKHERSINIVTRKESQVEHDAIKMLGVAASTEAVPGGMSVAGEESLYWFIEMELSRILERHAQFVENNGRYAFGGIQPLQKMLSFGVIEMTAKAMRSTDLLLMRTDMLHQAGLLSMTAEELKATSLNQAQYRALKAKVLLNMRAKRNQARAATRQALAKLHTQPQAYIEAEADNLLTSLTPQVEQMITDAALLTALIKEKGNFAFDGATLQDRLDIIKASVSSLDNVFGSAVNLLKRLGVEDNHKAAKQSAAAVAARYNRLKLDALGAIRTRLLTLADDTTKAVSIPEMLAGHAQCSLDADLSATVKRELSIVNRCQFQEAYASKKDRMASRLSFLGTKAA